MGPFHSVSGVIKSPNIQFSSTKLDRCPILSLFDSGDPFCDPRKTPKLSTLPKDKRFRYEHAEKRLSVQMFQKKLESSKGTDREEKAEEVIQELGDEPHSSKKKQLTKTNRFKIPLTYEQKLRQTFDASSYEKMKKTRPLDLNPIVINKLSKSKVFDASFARTQSYRSTRLESTVADNIRSRIDL